MNFESMNEKLEYKKAMVRPIVTYVTLGFYIAFTMFLAVVILFTETEFENGLLTVYTGISTLTASIVSFWFGGRGAKNSSGNG